LQTAYSGEVFCIVRDEYGVQSRCVCANEHIEFPNWRAANREISCDLAEARSARFVKWHDRDFGNECVDEDVELSGMAEVSSVAKLGDGDSTDA
jgi:hypothetical protein